MTIKNLRLGHKGESKECAGEVVCLKNCSDFFFYNVELYGCGTYGLTSYGSNVDLVRPIFVVVLAVPSKHITAEFI